MPFIGAILAILFFERFYKRISFTEGDMSVMEHFYANKKKQIFNKKQYSEELIDDDRQEEEHDNGSKNTSKDSKKKSKQLKIETFEDE